MQRRPIAALALRIAPLLLFVGLAPAGLGPAAPREARAGERETQARPPGLTGALEERGGVPVLRLWGSPRERGFAHGWLLAREIVGGAGRSLEAFLGERIGLYESMLLPLAKRAFAFSPAERAELEGILEGIESRLPEAADRTITALGRPARLEDLVVVNVFGDVYALACASLAVWGTGVEGDATLVARNFDFPALDLVVAHQHVRIVAPREDARGWLGLSYPGCIGTVTALNDAGVFVAIHDVHVSPSFLDLGQANVPRLVALRRLMEQLDAPRAVERAVELCRSWNTLYGNNFMVATPAPDGGHPAGVLEYDTRDRRTDGVALRLAADGETHVACTNHHLLRGEGTCWRLDALTGACAGDEAAPGSVAALFATMGQVSFPERGEKVEPGALATLHQVVAETGARRLHVRMAGVGENVREKAPVAFEVPAELERTGREGRPAAAAQEAKAPPAAPEAKAPADAREAGTPADAR